MPEDTAKLNFGVTVLILYPASLSELIRMKSLARAERLRTRNAPAVFSGMMNRPFSSYISFAAFLSGAQAQTSF